MGLGTRLAGSMPLSNLRRQRLQCEVKFALDLEQSVQAPMGMLNMNAAVWAVLAVFSTASVSTTAGNAEAARSVGLSVL